jgi:hypothetical protein
MVTTTGGVTGGNALARPGAGEYAPYYAGYVALVPDGEILTLLRDQLAETEALLREFRAERGDHRYAPGKWSVKEIVGHVADAERVFAYRALRFARGDTTPLPGYEQDDFVRGGNFAARALPEIAGELRSVRMASITLFAGLSEEALLRRGHANGVEFSVRALAWIIAGHERHHAKIIRERYLERD